MSSSLEKKMLILRSSDGEEFVVPEVDAVMSKTIKNMVEDECTSNTIPVPNVNVDANILGVMIEFCKKHAESEAEAASDLKTFDSEFVNRGREVLYHLITAADFLDVKELLHALCQKVADMIKGKSVHQIRIQFLGYQLFEILTSNFIWNIWCDRHFD